MYLTSQDTYLLVLLLFMFVLSSMVLKLVFKCMILHFCEDPKMSLQISLHKHELQWPHNFQGSCEWKARFTAFSLYVTWQINARMCLAYYVLLAKSCHKSRLKSIMSGQLTEGTRSVEISWLFNMRCKPCATARYSYE